MKHSGTGRNQYVLYMTKKEDRTGMAFHAFDSLEEVWEYLGAGIPPEDRVPYEEWVGHINEDRSVRVYRLI